jgi:hypothetical protein
MPPRADVVLSNEELERPVVLVGPKRASRQRVWSRSLWTMSDSARRARDHELRSERLVCEAERASL